MASRVSIDLPQDYFRGPARQTRPTVFSYYSVVDHKKLSMTKMPVCKAIYQQPSVFPFKRKTIN